MSSLEYLEEERKQLWAKIVQLEEDIQKKTSDHEKDARQSSKKTSEFRNKSEDAKNQTYEQLHEAQEANAQTQEILQQIKDFQGNIQSIYNDLEEKQKTAEENTLSIDGQLGILTTKISQLEAVFVKHPDIDSEIALLETIFVQGSELQSKIMATHKSCLTKKTEIDELYYDIVGYTESEEGKEDTFVEGLKDKLEKSFEDLKNNLGDYAQKITGFKEEKEKEVLDFLDKWKLEIEQINQKIKSLLPYALTAGLSAAYSEKKTAEESEIKKHEGKFLNAIIGLVVISIIPFIVNIALWNNGKTLEELILNMPRMVSAILPLYLPLLWFAYVANKNLNLSKRLVEEYTHKEVLSKTFEGLSTQISDIDNEDISSELKIKLIYNILEISSENPGKLITDYNKADHPLVEKLSKIPGLGRLSNLVQQKSIKILENETTKAEEGLSSLEKNT